ncbi:hypothetical protein QR680_012593 [Steinernema hermaphroditum]|uniref:DNA topoisomerase 2 n=1 Tax=Steinernema hermaphroditum TaxID=289476 RepID=A0AA39I431_9BILA|nr:hypothetical protein QR680_012593 [Steinernema hermaphroditum]
MIRSAPFLFRNIVSRQIRWIPPIRSVSAPPKTPPTPAEVASAYRRLTPIQHILQRPDSYIGSTLPTDEVSTWLFDAEQSRMVKREVGVVPGFMKIFDEILVNAADNKQRDKAMTALRIDVDRVHGEISIWNNGRGIPVVKHPDEGIYVPSLIFGTLLTSSNFDDTQLKTVGGRNGYGAKLCSIYSTEFHVETASTREGLRFAQSWTENMQQCGEALVAPFEGADYTLIRFRPDFARFGMSGIDDVAVEFIRKRAFDVAATLDGSVEVFLDGAKVEIPSFREYVDLYHESDHVEHCKVTPRWEIALTASDSGFQHVSFVNNISTTKGGRHVDYIADQIVSRIREYMENHYKAKLRPFQIKSHLFLFVNCLIENPSFDSQTKEYLTLSPKSFGSKCEVPVDFVIGAIEKSGIIEEILADINKKETKAINSSTRRPLHHLHKLEDANLAGTSKSSECSLIVTEGDSAKALAIAGFEVVGRDRYGVFPIRGKLLNVRQVPTKRATENVEISALMQILGLQFGADYSDPRERGKLRYGNLMIMVDQDQDGSHIKGLLINFLHHFWPSLIRTDFVQCFITPLLKAKRGADVKSFYRISDYLRWRGEDSEHKKHSVKYYKGLGTSTAAEAREYFSQIEKHRIQFEFGDESDDERIQMAFAKDGAAERKKWISDFIASKAQGVSDEIEPSISYGRFINQELVQFSEYDLRRSIPSLVDGLKPSQRKVLFACFKRTDNSEIKVNRLAGAVAHISAYHHGEESLVNTIVRLAQNFVGSNNLNLLQPIGQFGTRHQGGSDCASARYIYTRLSPVTRLLFPAADDAVLSYLTEDDQPVEPKWYCPVIPLVLVNGAEGIGTGWATSVLSYDPRVLIENVRCLMDGTSLKPMMPFYRGFGGRMTALSDGRFEVRGISRKPATRRKNGVRMAVEISELPIGVWTQSYKEKVLQGLLNNGIINGFKEYHTENSVRFVVDFVMKHVSSRTNWPKTLKLTTSLASNQMWLFNEAGALHHYPQPEDVLGEFFDIRKQKYAERKEYMEEKLGAQFEKARNQHNFMDSIISGRLELRNRPLSDIEAQLRQMGFAPDPIGDRKKEGGSYRYLLDMSLAHLSEEEKRKLEAKMETKKGELEALRETSWKELWRSDLDALEKEVRMMLQ